MAHVNVSSQRQRHYIEAEITPRAGPNFQGREWEVTIIGAATPADLVTVQGREYIRSKNKRLYSVDGLKASVPTWGGVRVFDNHLTNAEFKERAGMRSITGEWLGSLVDPRWDESAHGLRATFKLVDEPTARKLLNAHQAGVLDTIGLSIDTIPVKSTDLFLEGRRVSVIEGFKRIFSVDLVENPAAGGGFDRLIAATQQQQEAKMPITLEQLEARVAQLEEALSQREQNDDGGPAPETPEEAADEVAQAAAAVAEEAPPEADPAQVAQVAADAAQAKADEIAEAEPPEEAPGAIEEALATVRRLESRVIVLDALDASKLPADAQKFIREAFEGRVAEKDEVGRMVESTRAMLAARDGSGRVRGAGGNGGQIKLGLTGGDWRELEFLRLLSGNMKFRGLEAIEDETVKERMAETAYGDWVKAGRVKGNTRRMSEWMYEGFGDPFSRALEAATTSTLSSVVKNTVNILLAADFAARHQWWQPLVREESVDTIDTATLVRFYGVSNLDVVPEGNAYVEKILVDEEETATFVKKGNYIGITMETLMRDKVNKVRRLPELLADAWYNTLSSLVATVFTTNTNAGPALTTGAAALFNNTALTSSGGHKNLLTAALNYVNYGAARTAMAKQTSGNLGTGPKLLVRPKFLLVPVDLESAAIQIMKSEDIPGSANNDPNVYQNECEVIVVPEWTDVNNWALLADPARFPVIWLFWYRGQKVPELFTSDSETQGAMFTNDELRYKVRQMSYRFSSTYTCAPVSDWRGAHKNNVS